MERKRINRLKVVLAEKDVSVDDLLWTEEHD